MWINYPNNPTAATAERSFLKDAVDFCLKHDIILAHDFAYSEIAFDGYRAPSVLEIDGARECAVEFHSLSKTYSMTGWRVGFVVGNAAAVGAMGKVKTNIDSGVFQAVQEAAIAALEGGEETLHRVLRHLSAKTRPDGRRGAQPGTRMRQAARDLLYLGRGSQGLYLGIFH